MHEELAPTLTIEKPAPPVAKKPGFFEKLFNWELWPAWVLFALLSPFWLWYMIRARSFWFFTASNPTIPFGGYEGETKMDIYKQLPNDIYPRTILVKAGEAFNVLKKRMADAGFQYPFIVKPDIGRKGLLFRKIDTEAQLLEYHNYLPIDYLIQDLVDLPMELGVFYVRYPTEKRGKITGIILRESMEVWGDGLTPLRELILKHPQASKRADVMFLKHQDKLDWVPGDRERYVLMYAINRSRGGRLRNLTDQADTELTAFFDKINLHSQHFFWGRYDIKCSSIEELKKGENFAILEYNGAGASPSHIYHCGMTLFQACSELRRHWKMLFEISKWNLDHGIKHLPFMEGLRYLKKVNRHLDKLEEYELGAK